LLCGFLVDCCVTGLWEEVENVEWAFAFQDELRRTQRRDAVSEVHVVGYNFNSIIVDSLSNIISTIVLSILNHKSKVPFYHLTHWTLCSTSLPLLSTTPSPIPNPQSPHPPEVLPSSHLATFLMPQVPSLFPSLSSFQLNPLSPSATKAKGLEKGK